MVSVQPAFVIEATYAPDAAERRVPVRAEHLERAAEMMREGTLLLAGAFEDMSASLLVVLAPSGEAALAIAHADVYWRERVWTNVAVRPFNNVVA